MPSKFVKEIIAELKNNPEDFCDNNGQGVIRINKEWFKISGYGNTRILSIIDVRVGQNKYIPLLWIDKFLLEVAVKKWYKNATLKMLCD